MLYKDKVQVLSEQIKNDIKQFLTSRDIAEATFKYPFRVWDERMEMDDWIKVPFTARGIIHDGMLLVDNDFGEEELLIGSMDLHELAYIMDNLNAEAYNIVVSGISK
jgi:hypothetical protein